MNDTAYLCVWLKAGQVIGIDIHSEPPGQLTTTGDTVLALLMEMKGDTFHDAKTTLLAQLENYHCKHPVKALAMAFGLLPMPREQVLEQVLLQVRGRLEGMQKYISDRNLGEKAEEQFMLNERILRRIDAVIPSRPQDKAPCSPTCGDNRQVWKIP